MINNSESTLAPPPNCPKNGVHLYRLGRRTLDRRVYPHLLRHSSATYWAARLPYFQFCKRFGWKMNSPMPERYIDKHGLHELDAVRAYRSATRNQPTSNDPASFTEPTPLKPASNPGRS